MQRFLICPIVPNDNLIIKLVNEPMAMSVDLLSNKGNFFNNKKINK